MLIVDQVALGALFSGKGKHEFIFALHINPLTARVWDHTSPAMQAIVALYNNQINARALIGQSAVVYCAGKPKEKSRVF